MCTVLPLKQDYSGKNIAAKKRTRQDAFNKNTTIDSIAPRDIAADEMLPVVPLMKRPRSCFHQTSTSTTTAAATPPTKPKIHIIPQKTVMFADQMEQHQHDDDEDDSSSSSNEEDDDIIISIIDSVLGFAGDIPSTDAATDADAEQKEDVNVDDHDDHRDTWYHREELRAFQVEARNEVLADLARRVANHRSRKNNSSTTHASSKSIKLKNLLKRATSTTATAATTTTRGLERFDLFRAREKAAARKIVLLAYEQKMGGDQIASIAKRCSDRAVKQAITLARQDFNEVYPQITASNVESSH
mmetsp:Transcript_1128/g.2497  ORF Transcript_1128/g.2497 Transcript_1128/m.2497 type:complete len:301 (-) Transcript_1128:210-1112(-)|eukprot:CAMPEP_0113483038 /NCGR_PEP_ID=MMETSP0014_2-20120614/23229_1 /TAXON_ID=2857 /ORGANISM="Nitzschia sp." /LENGTH=300 /DNA_ID=CAMNT_0000376575 /DNA_START=310 /DNA_END=1215 /DNA_ORIENTATION=- /assembly_acc=CAM_ASM_000159